MSFIGIFLTIVIIKLCQPAQYSEAICNDDLISYFRLKSSLSWNITNNSFIGEQTVAVDVGELSHIILSAVQPGTGIIYVLYANSSLSPSAHFLGTFDISTSVITRIAFVTTSDGPSFGGMTFECDGSALYGIDERVSNSSGYQGTIRSINIMNGNHKIFAIPSGDCQLIGDDACTETIAFNWDNRKLYRISDGTGFSRTLYVREGNGSETSIGLPRGACNDSGNAIISGFEYIGNHLFYIVCNGNNGGDVGIRLLDTRDMNDNIVLTDLDGTLNGPVDIISGRTKAILPYLAGSVCVPGECLTNEPTINPTMNLRKKSNRDSSESGSRDDARLLINIFLK
eukprot:27308_1